MKDNLLNATGDVDLSSGDIAYGEATEQHQRDILIARQGDYRLDPIVGVGVADYLLDEQPDRLLAEIRRQYSLDGMEIKKLEITPDKKIALNAHYAKH
jgi:hypothetical protein